jgi:hypothetical protein
VLRAPESGAPRKQILESSPVCCMVDSRSSELGVWNSLEVGYGVEQNQGMRSSLLQDKSKQRQVSIAKRKTFEWKQADRSHGGHAAD